MSSPKVREKPDTYRGDQDDMSTRTLTFPRPGDKQRPAFYVHFCHWLDFPGLVARIRAAEQPPPRGTPTANQTQRLHAGGLQALSPLVSLEPPPPLLPPARPGTAPPLSANRILCHASTSPTLSPNHDHLEGPARSCPTQEGLRRGRCWACTSLHKPFSGSTSPESQAGSPTGAVPMDTLR